MNVGYSYALGFFVTFMVGGVGALLPIVGTQAMDGDESFMQIAGPAISIYVAAFGVGAVLGFVTLVRSNFRTYASIVAGFVVGGAFGGLLLSIGIAHHIGVLWVLGPIVPYVVGAVTASAAAPSTGNRGAAPLFLGVMKALFLAIGVIGLVAYLFDNSRRESGPEQARRALASVSSSGGEDALYNGLRWLEESRKAGVGAANPTLEALEV